MFFYVACANTVQWLEVKKIVQLKSSARCKNCEICDDNYIITDITIDKKINSIAYNV